VSRRVLFHKECHMEEYKWFALDEDEGVWLEVDENGDWIEYDENGDVFYLEFDPDEFEWCE
jgi:hypothetical protein